MNLCNEYSLLFLVGRDLYSHFHNDADTGFEQTNEATLTLDQIVAMNQIKRTVESLENKLDKIQVRSHKSYRIYIYMAQW